ncbi:MAG: glutathione S-transferase N-terminal domain-containing protein [Hyphomicrobiaceae bacterium]|nr:glutathione S-transferase N-terminal domain-containing protein [Hyphomicrobiaceae bacterium]
MYTLLSATPSPYARKVRIALIEKGIPFALKTEVPWDNTTETPRYNPLEKLPVLITESGESVYESRFILEWLEARHPMPPMLPDDVDGRLAARQMEVLADGVCDAFVLHFFERHREPGKQSHEWLARQRRKIDGGLKEIARRIGDREYAVGDRFGLADIAAATVAAYLAVRYAELDWRSAFPNLAAYSDRMELRPSLAATKPVPQKISDKVV